MSTGLKQLNQDTRKRGYAPRRVAKKKRRTLRHILVPFLLICVILVGVFALARLVTAERDRIENPEVAAVGKLMMPVWVEEDIIPHNCDSRRGEYLEELNGIVIHYVGNPNTSAKQNRDYYANEGTEVNSHFLVGLDGEIIQCLPLQEKSSATSERNRDTISIEVCHPDEGGKFSDKSYAATVRLTAWLCQQTGLDASQVIRHYDATGKECPLYYVKNPDAWQTFLLDVEDAINQSMD